MQTTKLYKRRNDFGEYVIKTYNDGRHLEECDYLTDDFEDALGTLRQLANGATIIETTTIYYFNDKGGAV